LVRVGARDSLSHRRPAANDLLRLRSYPAGARPVFLLEKIRRITQSSADKH
jgi:hypothetical protein